ncbi:DUF2570 family protein [Marinobacter nauticus]|uniref:DUF2570 domain-containing protein n=1 Tax=Marinobacter nauticus TaxID=2743 RepID=A0A1M2V0X5_MARNT|nr:DUF2570 family protein [Marinobacter nauticus]OJT01222.1 hypothetical protein BEE62_14835 [Marinobacter nauticus]
MIFSALKAKAMPLAATLITAIIAAMGVLIWWLYQDNKALTGQADSLEQANNQLIEHARSQAAANHQLNTELKRRDRVALEAAQARDRYASQARKAEEELRHALDNSECAAQPHPVAVGDWLRKHSDDY